MMSTMMHSLGVTLSPTSGPILSPGEDIPNDPGKMFIGGLSWQTTPESIREYFQNFGELAEVMVMKDPATRRSRGFGFITFSDPTSVEQVLLKPVHQLDGKLVEPKVAVPRKTNPKLVMRTRKIFVGGLSATTSLEDIKAYFEQFSKVKEAMLAYDKVTHRHRGFGFVTFDNEDVVDKICEIHFHEINGKMVESKKALPKEPRSAYCGGYGHMGFGHYSPPRAVGYPGRYPTGFHPQYENCTTGYDRSGECMGHYDEPFYCGYEVGGIGSGSMRYCGGGGGCSNKYMTDHPTGNNVNNTRRYHNDTYDARAGGRVNGRDFDSGVRGGGGAYFQHLHANSSTGHDYGVRGNEYPSGSGEGHNVRGAAGLDYSGSLNLLNNTYYNNGSGGRNGETFPAKQNCGVASFSSDLANGNSYASAAGSGKDENPYGYEAEFPELATCNKFNNLRLSECIATTDGNTVENDGGNTASIEAANLANLVNGNPPNGSSTSSKLACIAF